MKLNRPLLLLGAAAILLLVLAIALTSDENSNRAAGVIHDGRGPQADAPGNLDELPLAPEADVQERVQVSIDEVAEPAAAVDVGSLDVVLADEAATPVEGTITLTYLGRRNDDAELVTRGARSPSPQIRRTSGGSAHFDELEVGVWRAEVDPDSIPAGYLAPYMQGVECNFPLPPGFTATTVDVGPGQATASLQVHSPAQVEAIVQGPSGESISGATVRILYHLPCLEGLHYDQVTDDRGVVEFASVYPGHVYLQVFPGAAHKGLSRPERYNINLAPGGFGGPAYLVLGGGDVTLSGRVVDGTGKPYEGLPVFAIYVKDDVELDWWEAPYRNGDVAASGVTDRDGRYRMRGLPRQRIRVHFTRGYSPDQPVGEKDWAGWVDLVPVALQDQPSDHVDLGTRTVWRSRPYVLKGTVLGSDGKLKESGSGTVTLLHDVVLPPEYDTLHRPGFEMWGQQTVDIQSDGTFTWACETPHGPVALTLGEAQYTIRPAADTTEEQDFEWVDAP